MTSLLQNGVGNVKADPTANATANPNHVGSSGNTTSTSNHSVPGTAAFDQTSHLSRLPHDPFISLASNCIRDSFGPTVQLVADCLQFRGEPSSLAQLLATLRQKCRAKVWSLERIRLLGTPLAASLVNPIVEEPIRAALIVLIQHSIVQVQVVPMSAAEKKNRKRKDRGKKFIAQYSFVPERACMMQRYPRFVEYAKKALDNMAAALVEELLVQGRLRTVEAVSRTVERLGQQEQQSQQQTDDTPPATASTFSGGNSRLSTRQAVLESFKRLAQGGFLEQVPKIVDPAARDGDESDEDEDPDEGEYEFEDDDDDNKKNQKSKKSAKEPPTKKVKIQDPGDDHKAFAMASNNDEDDPAIVALLMQGNTYRGVLPQSAVWRVNIPMFQDTLRAFLLGRCVAERHGHRVQSAGSMITAALKYIAHQQHGLKTPQQRLQQQESAYHEGNTVFDAQSILRYMNKPVLQLLEKVAGTKQQGSVVATVARSLKQLSRFRDPMCIIEVETGAKVEHSKFEISIARLVKYLQRRIIHQMISDAQGEDAARIVSILTLNGHLESDSIADASMVPAKDSREILHRLYRSRYIDLFTLNQARQHNPSSMIYLWNVDSSRILRSVTDDVCRAILNLRLRRQHEIELGKNWIERAQEAGDTDENDHEGDKLNHRKFCLGLERLYNSTLQLDETLMVLLFKHF